MTRRNVPPELAAAVSRRGFLARAGLGFGALALDAMLFRDGYLGAAETSAGPIGLPHFAPKAKSVIWLFMIGGASHLETFDPKPALNEYAGKSVDETPHKHVLEVSYVKDNLRKVAQVDANGHIWPTIYPLQVGYAKRGECGTIVSDWLPHLSTCVDEISVVRSMWTTDNDHGAQLQFHTGRHTLDGNFPTIGSWVRYGLGSLNDDLPSYVVLGTPLADCCGGKNGQGADYLGPQYAGVQLKVDPKDPLPFAAPPKGVYREEQAAEFSLLSKLHKLAAEEDADPALRARLNSYELAFRMQTAVPSLMDFTGETAETHKLYGLDDPATKPFGEQCLAARRMVERGVRFVQVFHGSNGGAGAWDSHSGLKTNHANLCKQTDQPVAALLKDLERRGLLDETLVVWGTEFGRTPGAQNSDGRDHHPYGFSVWLAGGGIKRGVVHGATDELGFHASEDRHYVTDLHATVMKQLGLDPRRLDVPGRKRLEIDYGKPIEAIIA